jgi:hypothetical protein
MKDGWKPLSRGRALVWALRSQRNGHSHQLLAQGINGTVFEFLFVKSPKGFSSFQVHSHPSSSAE